MGFRRAIPAIAFAAFCAFSGFGCRGSAPAPSVFPAPPSSAPVPASLALEGCRFDSARAIVETYCADCHAGRGAHPLRERAHLILSVDTYRDWMGASRAVPGKVDRDSLEGGIMPPPDFPRQPTAAERRTLADWVKRGSPNTPNGR